jgi:hypothetical protein
MKIDVRTRSGSRVLPDGILVSDNVSAAAILCARNNLSVHRYRFMMHMEIPREYICVRFRASTTALAQLMFIVYIIFFDRRRR